MLPITSSKGRFSKCRTTTRWVIDRGGVFTRRQHARHRERSAGALPWLWSNPPLLARCGRQLRADHFQSPLPCVRR